jgi:flagellar biosynthetic protein FliP
VFGTLCLGSSLVYAAPSPDVTALATDVAADAMTMVDPAAPPASGAQTALRILVMMTVLSMLPAIVLTMTSFTRIIIVFSFLRQALGIQGMPPNQLLTGMALFLTAFIMAPVAEEIHTVAIEPLGREEIDTMAAVQRATEPLSKFMLAHTDDEDLRLFYDVSDRPRPATREDVDFIVLVPAFVLSEVRTAFEMGFLVLIPFMVIDLVVSSILMAMGMMMLPPALVTLPVKIMVFVLVDGWGLIIGSLVRSFQ